MVLSDEEDTLVLTEQSARQLIKDRKDYGDMLQTNAEMAAQKTQDAAVKKMNEDQAKALSVFRSMSKGDNVPPSDERRLMDYDKKLYQAGKMAQAMAQMAKKRSEDKDSEWDEREEKEYRRKMDELCDESNEAARSVGSGSREFSEAQKQNIVEIEAPDVELSSVKTCNLGSGLTGEYIDLSL